MIIVNRQSISLTDGDFLGFNFRMSLLEGYFSTSFSNTAMLGGDFNLLYITVAEYFASCIEQLSGSENHIKDSLITIVDECNDTEVILSLLNAIYYSYKGISNVIYSYVSFFKQAIVTLNDYVITHLNLKLEDYVNNLSWPTGGLPYHWKQLCSICGYNTTDWISTEPN